MTVSLVIYIISSQCSYRESCKCRSSHLTRYNLLIVCRFTYVSFIFIPWGFIVILLSITICSECYTGCKLSIGFLETIKTTAIIESVITNVIVIRSTSVAISFSRCSTLVGYGVGSISISANILITSVASY